MIAASVPVKVARVGWGLPYFHAEMEMKNKFVNHARNVWERAVYYLPREDQFWFKYAYMEELIGEYVKARGVFARWMEWGPGEKAWMAYLRFEERMGEPVRAKQVLYGYLEARYGPEARATGARTRPLAEMAWSFAQRLGA
mgnify:CR=1 FL=1